MIDEYKYLWEDPSAGWGLLHLGRTDDSGELEYGIVNLEDESMLLIEDNSLYAAVKRQMLAHGVRVVHVREIR